jgi:hypothetical protein
MLTRYDAVRTGYVADNRRAFGIDRLELSKNVGE